MVNFSGLDFSKTRVLVVGDVMLDRYWHGPVSRISPEAPVPIVHVKESEERVGGAGNVALNVRALGANVTLMAAVGVDAYGDSLVKHLEAAGISCLFQRLPNVPTINKLRILSRHQQLIRLDFEEYLNAVDYASLERNFAEEVKKADIVILSDYGKGTLAKAIRLIGLANEAKVPVFVDPKSQQFQDYKGATVVTPNFNEFKAVVGQCETEGEIVEHALRLISENDFEALLITRGEKGMTLIEPGEPELHIPSQAKEVYDVSGAGDTVIATLATAYASGLSLSESVFVANAAAGVVVGKLGTATVSLPELKAVLTKVKSISAGVLNKEQLLLALTDARMSGERIVMTNGCFDLLHAGHVYYLEQAKALGDRLIVAVNDDASVSRLKGVGRPINSCDKRMAVLAGLQAVDWVVSFSEDTPVKLIEAVLPDVLVKGGDYQLKDIAGADAVLAHGGEVKVLGFLDGHSTTDMLKKITDQA